MNANLLKDNKKNLNKAWLSQRVSEIGRDQLLYASNNTGRHIYTKEVLLLAEQEGLTQSEMAGMSGVSQSQVSQWISGQSKATNEQLSPLIDQISSVMPGISFHVEKVVKRAFLCLPENWEEQAVEYYLRKRVGRRVNISPISVQEYAYGGLIIEEGKELNRLREGYKANIELLTNKSQALEELKASCDKERKAFQESLIAWSENRTAFLSDNPEIAELSKDKRNNMLDRQFPKPTECKMYEVSLVALLSEELADDYKEQDNEAAFKLLVARIVEDKKVLDNQLLLDGNLIREKYAREKEIRKVYGRYDNGVYGYLKARSINPLNLKKDLIQISSELYNTLDFTLAYKESEQWDTIDREVKLIMDEAFVEYTLNLLKGRESYEDYLKIEFEDIQICGEKIFGKNISEDGNRFSGLRCYKLFSKKLAVILDYEYDDSGEYFTQLYIYENAREALEDIISLQECSGLTDDEVLDLKLNLAQSGYKTPDYRSIY